MVPKLTVITPPRARGAVLCMLWCLSFFWNAAARSKACAHTRLRLAPRLLFLLYGKKKAGTAERLHTETEAKKAW